MNHQQRRIEELVAALQTMALRLRFLASSRTTTVEGMRREILWVASDAEVAALDPDTCEAPTVELPRLEEGGQHAS